MYKAKEEAKVFSADNDYMYLTYQAQAFDSENVEFEYEQEDALDLCDYEIEDDGSNWGEGYWADIVHTRTGDILAVVADGEWGQPSTEYLAVIELEELSALSNEPGVII